MTRSLLAPVTNFVRNLRYSYLFLPGLVALAFAGLSFALAAIDSATGGSATLFPAGPGAARTVLATIGSTLATVAGVAFSITIVSLQLVSQQFTPRALRTFLADRLNQTIAGIFIGGFLYCLVALRHVRDTEEAFVPGLTVTVAVAIAFVALGSLLVFVHHMAHSIDVANISARIARETDEAARELYPESYGDPGDADADALVEQWHRDGESLAVHPEEDGFVQSVDDLPRTIGGSGFRIHLLVAPGDFVTRDHPLARVWSDRDPDACRSAIRRAIAVAAARDLRQDIGYGLRQLADIAVKALSPSVNDPTTATTCIAHLQGILERLAARPLPSRVREFPDRDITIVMRRDEFADYLEALLQIGRYATADARPLVALLRAVARIVDAAIDGGQVEHARAAREAGARIARRGLGSDALDPSERDVVEDLLRKLETATASVAR